MARASRIVVTTLMLGATTMMVSCIASSLINSNQRMLQLETTDREWSPPSPTDIAGQFESTEITGEAAGSVLRIYYYFASNGRFTGAALLVGTLGPTFQVLEGRWSLSKGKLSLGPDSDPATVHKSGDLLRLTTSGGRVVLKRVTL